MGSVELVARRLDMAPVRPDDLLCDTSCLSCERLSLLPGAPGAASVGVVRSTPTPRSNVFRRPLLLLPAVIAAIALPVAPALAGEGDGTAPTPSDPSAPAAPAAPAAPSAKLKASHSCRSGKKATASVSGAGITSVAFHLDGKLVKTVKKASAGGRYSMSMSCSRLRTGANRGRAVVKFAQGASPASQTLGFQITRARAASPRFTG
jgi:hypothetical protein